MNKSRHQRGGTLLGFVIGLVLGLAIALAVAMYVTKVPTPFSSKIQNRSAEQDALENEKNKDWNPNGALQPRAVMAASEPAAALSASAPAATGPDVSRPEIKPAVQADPLGDLVNARAGLSTSAAQGQPAEPFSYFVQVGAYRSVAEAESQKARMALMGLDAKVSEREQAGRTVYRVRLGPFEDKGSAERVHAKLDGASVESTIVRTQR